MSKFIGLVSAYAYAKSKGYTGTEEEFATLMAHCAFVAQRAVDAERIATESAQSAAAASSDVNRVAATVTQQAAQVHDDAETSSENAATASEAKETAVSKALDSEAWAVGQRDGEDVGTQDETYHNNAKWYAESAGSSAQTASDAAQTATQKASDAQASAEAAAESARTLTIDTEPTEDSTNAISSGAVYELKEELSGDISDLNNQLIVIDNKVKDLAVYPNLANPAKFISGYMGLDGTTYSNENIFYTAKIPVSEGQTIKANHRARFITAFSGDTANAESGVNDQTGGDATTTYVVPEGIDGLVFSFINSYAVNLMIYVYDGVEYEYIPYGKIAYMNPDILPTPLKVITSRENRPIYKETSGVSFVANTFISLPVFSCTRKNTRLVYRANIASLGNFEIGFTTAANSSGTKYNRFVIRANGVIAYLQYDYTTSDMVSESVYHNLGITSGSLQIIIEEHPNATVTITIENNGNTWKHTFEGYVKNNTLQPYCYSAFGSFSNYKFVWSCTDLDKKTWIFGDSYMAYSDARWPYYLEEYGYAKNALFNSFPGCWSSTAITALNSLINYGNPKYIVWAMGMNDGSDSESAPSTSWANNRDSFITICEENNIEPIFCTIPTVPTVNNEQKNAWIKSSGYRYIDFAKAVNASASGVWSAGTLSGDGVHPTVNGAKALFAELLLDFPEIMQGLDGNYQ